MIVLVQYFYGMTILLILIKILYMGRTPIRNSSKQNPLLKQQFTFTVIHAPHIL